jgi:glutamate 5-kinase
VKTKRLKRQRLKRQRLKRLLTNMGNRIVIKIGSQVLCNEQGQLDVDVLSGLVSQTARLMASGWQLLLVSSGAVAAGSGLVDLAASRISDPVARRQVLAATGQVHLMETYQRCFREHGIEVAQVLTSSSDFQTRRHYLNMRACIEALLDAGIVPVVNENDVVTVTELMFTDNDELAGLVASLIGADLMCLMSHVDGVYDGQPEEQGANRISRWDDTQYSFEDIVQRGTSMLGRGGMHSKLAMARKTAKLGTEVVIANGSLANVLLKIVAGDDVGTRFPAGKEASPTKRWLAGSDRYASAYVVVNDGAEAALRDKSRLASLLLVGIETVHGEFQDGDIIRIQNRDGEVLGCGRARYDNEQALAWLGQQGHKPLVHYDYLYLEN